MEKRKQLVITNLPPEFVQVFDAVAEGLELTRGQFLISLMLQNRVIDGGMEHVICDPDFQQEWRDQLVQRQFDWANSI